MTVKQAPLCEHCQANTAIIKDAIVTKRDKWKGHYHFCTFDCIVKWAKTREANGTDKPKRKNKKRKTQQKPHKKRDFSKWRCGACGMLCANPHVLANHIKAKHEPRSYLELVKKTGGAVIESDGTISRGGDLPAIFQKT